MLEKITLLPLFLSLILVSAWNEKTFISEIRVQKN